MYIVKKEAFEWIRTGQKTIELRNWNREGDEAVFQCGRDIVRGRIIKKEHGTLREVLREDNYKKVIPIANSLEEAIEYIKKLYGTTEGLFVAYYKGEPTYLYRYICKIEQSSLQSLQEKIYEKTIRHRRAQRHL